MADLYNNVDVPDTYSLSEFNERAADLLMTQGDPDSFLHFALTGEGTKDGVTTQAFIDSVRGPVDPNHRLNVSRDYDSLIGISDGFLVDDAIDSWAVPHPTFALKRSIHITHRINYEGVSSNAGLSFTWNLLTSTLARLRRRIPPHPEF